MIVSVAAAGCGSNHNGSSPLLEQMVREESVSVLTENGDTIDYTVKIYQDQYYNVTVRAESGDESFEALEYEIDYDKALAENDTAVQWTTQAGKATPKDNDHWANAEVSVSSYGQTISQRKINFPNRTIETVTEVTH